MRLPSGKPEKNLLEMPYAASADFDALGLKPFDFFLNGGAPRLTSESTHPTGCGHDPMSGHFGRIGVVFHGLADPAISLGAQGMGDFLVGRHMALRYLSQQIVGFLGKCFHFSPSSFANPESYDRQLSF